MNSRNRSGSGLRDMNRSKGRIRGEAGAETEINYGGNMLRLSASKGRAEIVTKPGVDSGAGVDVGAGAGTGVGGTRCECRCKWGMSGKIRCSNRQR